MMQDAKGRVFELSRLKWRVYRLGVAVLSKARTGGFDGSHRWSKVYLEERYSTMIPYIEGCYYLVLLF